MERSKGEIVGENVRRLRQAMNWTQAHVADQAGIARPTLVNIEGGKFDSVSLDSLVALAKVFSVSTDELLLDINFGPINDAIEEYLKSDWRKAQKPTPEEISWLYKLPRAVWLGPQTIKCRIRGTPHKMASRFHSV